MCRKARMAVYVTFFKDSQTAEHYVVLDIEDADSQAVSGGLSDWSKLPSGVASSLREAIEVMTAEVSMS